MTALSLLSWVLYVQFASACCTCCHQVSLIRTEAEGQARDIMEVMDNTDAVLVAGGDGTVSEALTGLLRRQDANHAARRFPIGIAPLGRTNQLVLSVPFCFF